MPAPAPAPALAVTAATPAAPASSSAETTSPDALASGPTAPAVDGAVVQRAVARVVAGERLGRDEARAVMAAIMEGSAAPTQLAALLVALRMRGETADELAGFASAMRERAVAVAAPAGAVDLCGTGGDGSGTFNISTAAALVVAAAGAPVAKHGNRAVTSRAGSADLLEALGVPVDLDADGAAAALREDGFAFLFAPRFHPAMRHAGPTRRELGIPTCFNLLGPLVNPAGVRRQVVGVADARAAETIASVLALLGVERALVVRGERLDELPLDGSGEAFQVAPDGIRHVRVVASELGLTPAPTAALAGASAEENARIVEAVLAGEEHGPRRDVVLLNAAAALDVAGRADGLADGVVRAAETIDSGAAAALLDRLRSGGRVGEPAP